MKDEWRFSKDATEGKAHFLHADHAGGGVSICFIYPDGQAFWREYKNRNTGLKKAQAFVEKHTRSTETR